MMTPATNPDPKTASNESILPRRAYWLGLAVIALAFVAATILTWRKWPDALVDFGTQLYMPWRIANGAILYRDLFYFSGGPFSQHFNALLFKIFGVSFSTLIAANLILTAAMTFVIYRSFAVVADIWTATLSGLGIVLVFAFGQYTLGGNYNYIAPYTCESTHGLIFSIFTIACLSCWLRHGKMSAALAAGFCTGVVFLTKPEVFLALAATVAAAWVLFYLSHGLRNTLRSLTAFLLASIIPLLFFFLFFLRVESVRDSLRSVVYDWLAIFRGGIAGNTFYRWCTGLDQPSKHLGEIIVSFLAVVFVLAAYAFVLRWAKNLNSKNLQSPNVVLLLLISPLLFWAVRFDWRQCGWPLPLLSLVNCLLIAWHYRKQEQALAFPFLWSVFGLVLLAKLGLFPRVWHYGFVLAMPAFVSAIYLLFWLLPGMLERKWAVPARSFRIMVALVLLVGIGNLFDQSQLLYARKNLRIGNGGDEIVTYNSSGGPEIAAALAWAQTNMPSGATMAVLPDAIMFNYLTRHVNPTPCLFWDPNSLGVYGQSNMVAVFERNAPDYIFLVQRDSSEFGKGYFGSSPDFGQDLMEWVHRNYVREALFGSEPLKSTAFGIEIFKRRPVSQVQSGGFNASKSERALGERKFIPTSNEASVQPKPSRVM